MEEDLKAVLRENARLAEELVRSGVTASEDIHVIPIVIKYGAFSPKRLECWNYEELQRAAMKDEAFLDTIGTSLLTVACSNLQESAVTINEKKAVSFLLAAKSKAPLLVDTLLKRAAREAPRFFFIAREYLHTEADWLRDDFPFPVPFAPIKAFCPKFTEKFPSCAEFIMTVSAEPIRAAISGPSSDVELKFLAALAVRHYSNDPKWLYDNILSPAWASKSSRTARTALDALSQHPAFAEFCKDKLN